MKDIKVKIIIILSVLLIAGVVGTFSFKNMYDDLKTKIETVDANPEAVKLKADLDQLQGQFNQITEELNVVSAERDKADAAVEAATQKSNEVKEILDAALKEEKNYSTSSEKLRAYIIAIGKAAAKLK
jgi:Tfp pilus assembly protein FimV